MPSEAQPRRVPLSVEQLESRNPASSLAGLLGAAGASALLTSARAQSHSLRGVAVIDLAILDDSGPATEGRGTGLESDEAAGSGTPEVVPAAALDALFTAAAGRRGQAGSGGGPRANGDAPGAGFSSSHRAGDTRSPEATVAFSEAEAESQSLFRAALTDGRVEQPPCQGTGQAGVSATGDGTDLTAGVSTSMLRTRITPPPALPVLAVGADAGGTPRVAVLDTATGKQHFSFDAYDPSFRGGVRVAMGDVNADGTPDVITGPGAGGGSNVRVFDGRDGKPLKGGLGSFDAFETGQTDGLYVAAGDVDGDGHADVIVGTEAGGGLVKAFSGRDGSLLASFSVEGVGGVRVAAGDVNGDGVAEILTAAGPGDLARVGAYDVSAKAELYSFFAFDEIYRGGIYLAAGDLDGDGLADLVVGAEAGMPEVRVFRGDTTASLGNFLAFDAQGGVRVAVTDAGGDGALDIAAARGPGGGELRIFDGRTHGLLSEDTPSGGKAGRGLFVGGPWGASLGGGFQMLSVVPEVTLAVTKPVTVEGHFMANPLPGQQTGEYGTFTVTRSGSDFSASLTVGFTAGGTAASFGGDFYWEHPANWNGNAVIPAGQASTTIVVIPNDDALFEGPETVVVTLAPATDGSYTLGGDTQGVVVIRDNDAPSPQAAGLLGNPGGLIGLAPGLPAAGAAAAFGGGVVRPQDGTVHVGGADLSSGGFGAGWGHNRSWSNDPGLKSPSAHGAGVVVAQQPSLRKDSMGTIVVVTGATESRYFDYVAGQYVARHGGQEKLVYDFMTGRYTLTDTTGRRLVFFDFNANPEAKRGQLESFTASHGNGTTLTWGTDGRLLKSERSYTEGGVTLTESFVYAYDSSGRLESVTLQRQVNGGTAVTVRKARYAYYGAAEAHGNLDNLKSVTVEDGGGQTIDITYYRYYKPGDAGGYPGMVKAVVGPQSTARALAAGVDPAMATDAALAPYADTTFKYDGAGRVSERVVQGEGGAATGGRGTYTYAYTTSTFANGYNSWRTKTAETLPDGNQRIVFTNHAGQVMLEVFKETATGRQWLTFSRYDDSGRVVLKANPSAVSGYDETKADLVDASTGNFVHVRDNEGLIEKPVFASATTATATTPGDVAGYLRTANIQRGENGTPVSLGETNYYARTAGGKTIYPVASQTVTINPGVAATTTYSYDWHPDSLRAKSVMVTYPVVSAAQNGPGTADTETTFFDALGRVTWHKDGAGYLHYTAYDTATGAAVKTITDVDATRTSDFADLPSGWVTPTGGGLHLTTLAEVDALGRAVKATDPNGNATYVVYKDAVHEVRTYRGWDTTTNRPTGPTEVVRADRPGSYLETLTMTAAPTLDVNNRPTGTESVADLQTLSRVHVSAGGQATHSDAYFSLAGLTYTAAAALGTLNTHYYRTAYAYDSRGRRDRVTRPTGTVEKAVHDGRGRVTSEWLGTDDGSPGNMVKVREFEYDNGGVGDDNLTREKELPGGGAAERVTQHFHDWRNRVVAIKEGAETSEGAGVNRPVHYFEYDNLGRVVAQRRYDGDGVTVVDANADGVPDTPDSAKLRARAETLHDHRGRVYQEKTSSVDPSSGAISSTALTTNHFYDRRGLVIKTAQPGGLSVKTGYDGAGRAVRVMTSDGGVDIGWADAGSASGDVVLTQQDTAYDAAGNVIRVATYQRFHDDGFTGAINDAHARVSYAVAYYDRANRLTATVDVGTNGGTPYDRPATVPTRSDTVLVTSQAYNGAGWVETLTDPRGLAARSEYDALGRVVMTVEAYTDGVVTDTTNRTSEFSYDGSGHTRTLKVVLPGGGQQVTEWIYGVTTASGSAVNSNDLLASVKHPDPSTGAASDTQKDVYTVNALGEVVTRTDRNGTVHSYTHDVVGRLTADAVTTLGAGVDGAVRRLETAYDSAGLPYLFTGYDAASGGGVVNQVRREYNGLGQLTRDYQAHAGAVDTLSTPKVQYAYTEMAGGGNHSRLAGVIYPSGYVLYHNYDVGLDSTIGRLSSLSDTTGTLEGFSYLGLDTVVKRARSQTGVELTYVKQSGESDGDAGDQYTGLDRFGRVVDQRWRETLDGTHTDRLRYGYNRNGNVLYKQNEVNAVLSEVFSYDNLNQLSSFQRGTLNASKDGITGTPSRSQSWDVDGAGNFESVTTDGTAQARGHNKQNEITSLAGQTTPGYDANGNLTTDQSGRTLVYDAWGRLSAVKQGTTTLVNYKHDALGRRVVEDAGTPRVLYYSADWQVIEERQSGLLVARTVFSPVYVDALVLRDRDTNGDGVPDERLWVQQDANFNVTALVGNAGAVVERYLYDPYGAFSVLAPDWTSRASSLYGWLHLHQGGRYDGTSGLYHFRNRDFSPALMRWLQPDPLGFGGGDQNLYRAYGNGPVRRLDPSGLSWFGEVDAWVKAREQELWDDVAGREAEWWENFIPVYGSLRSAVREFALSEDGYASPMGWFSFGMGVVDIFTLGSLGGAVKGGWKGIKGGFAWVKGGAREGSEGLLRHTAPRGMSGAGEVVGAAKNVIPEGSAIQEITYQGRRYKYVHDPRLVEGVAYTDARGFVHINPKITGADELARVFDHEIVHVRLTPNRYSPSITWRQRINQWSYNKLETVRFLEETVAHTHDAQVMQTAIGRGGFGTRLRSLGQGLKETHKYRYNDGSRLVSYPRMSGELALYGYFTFRGVQGANRLGHHLFGVE